MGAGKLRVLAGRGVIAVGLAALVAGCGQARPTASLAPWQTPPPATPTMTPQAVPVLGKLAFGTFRATGDGTNALSLCEDWAGLRGQYVARVGTGTPYQLEQWFSSALWRPAFNASRSLRLDPHYGEVSIAFGLATTGAAASVGSAKLLDQACAAAD